MQKSQISYYDRHLYACVSFLKVKKKAELPEDYFVLNLGLSAPLESGRAAAKTEPYPGALDNAFRHQRPLGSGRRTVRLDQAGISICADKITKETDVSQ